MASLTQYQHKKRFKQRYLRQLRSALCRGGGEGGRSCLWQGGNSSRLRMQSTALSSSTGLLLVAIPRKRYLSTCSHVSSILGSRLLLLCVRGQLPEEVAGMGNLNRVQGSVEVLY